GRRSLDHFSGGDLIDESVRQDAYGGHRRNYSRESGAPSARDFDWLVVQSTIAQFRRHHAICTDPIQTEKRERANAMACGLVARGFVSATVFPSDRVAPP